MPPLEPEECVADTLLGRLYFYVYRDHVGGARIWRGTPLTREDGTLMGVAKDTLRIPWGPLSMEVVWETHYITSRISELYEPARPEFFIPHVPGSYKIRLTVAGPPWGPPPRTALAMVMHLDDLL